MTSQKYFFFLPVFLIVSCTQHPLPGKRFLNETTYSVSEGLDTVKVIIPAGKTFNRLPDKYSEILLQSVSDTLFNSLPDDSLKSSLKSILKKEIDKTTLYGLFSVSSSMESVEMVFTANHGLLINIKEKLMTLYVQRQSESFYPLFKNNLLSLNWDETPLPKLIFPCERTQVPQNAKLLPNAPREYRKGIHRGIDFFANWGAPVMAVADGTVLRADNSFEEISPEFRKSLLKSASNIKRTPSDVFEHILLGKTVILDHGLDLIPGFRVITIYAHLSHINENIKPEVNVSAGEYFAKTGNTGTEASTYGKKDGAHLHWEMILQNEDGEFYVGQGLPYEKLYTLLQALFK